MVLRGKKMAHPAETPIYDQTTMFGTYHTWQESGGVPKISDEVLWEEGPMAVRAASGNLAVRTYDEPLGLLTDVTALTRVRGVMPDHLEQGVAAVANADEDVYALYTTRPHRSVVAPASVNSDLVDGLQSRQLEQSLDALAAMTDRSVAIGAGGMGLTRYGVFVPRPKRVVAVEVRPGAVPPSALAASVDMFAGMLAFGGLVTCGANVNSSSNRIEAAGRVHALKTLTEIVEDRTAADQERWAPVLPHVVATAERVGRIAAGLAK
jgi:hypothetical protein